MEAFSREGLLSLLEPVESAISELQSRNEPRLEGMISSAGTTKAEIVAALASKGRPEQWRPPEIYHRRTPGFQPLASQAIYLSVYRSERSRRNGDHTSSLDHVNHACQRSVLSLSHPGGRRFEPG